MSDCILLEIARAGTGVYRPENKNAELDITNWLPAEIKEILEIQRMLNRPYQTKRYVKYDHVAR